MPSNVHCPRLLDVRASVHEVNGDGADGAYSLIGDGLTIDEFLASLRETLLADWGLTNSPGPFRLSVHIGPAGTGDNLPL